MKYEVYVDSHRLSVFNASIAFFSAKLKKNVAHWPHFFARFTINANLCVLEETDTMTYYIFGGSGFIGSHIVRFISEADKTAAVYNFDIVGSDHDGLSQYVSADVRKPIHFPNADNEAVDSVIINMAAIHRTPGHADEEYFGTNVRGAENVCNFARRMNIRRIVFISSIAVYGTSEEQKTEESALVPDTAYGKSKVEAETIHRMWQSESADRQLIILRPGAVFGQGERGNFERMAESIRRRRFVYPGRRDTIKASIYVKDLVGFLFFLLEQKRCNTEVYNCTFEPAYTISQTATAAVSALGLKRCLPCVPSFIIMPVAWLCKLMGSPMGICPARVRKLMISTNISGAKMADTGYQFQFTMQSAFTDWLSKK